MVDWLWTTFGNRHSSKTLKKIRKDRTKFKFYEQCSFLKRNRAIQPGSSPYAILQSTVKLEIGTISCDVINTNNNVSFKLTIDTLAKNSARIRITELSPIRPRYFVDDSLVKEPQKIKFMKESEDGNSLKVKFEANVVEITYKPLKIDFFDSEGVLLVSVNNKGLMNFEHYRNKQVANEESKPAENDNRNENSEETKSEDDKDEDDKEQDEPKEATSNESEKGLWEEDFKEHHDSKPYGPSSVGLDVSFVGFEHVYGIPEHADSLALKHTTGGDPYRLYNLDVFEYELDNPMALYGSIPYMMAHNAYKTVGVFWNNAAETWVDIASSKSVLSSLISLFKTGDIPEVDTHWMSESGIIDLFIMLGPKPHDVSHQYSTLTGTTTLPPMFGIAYHQCRWNYNDEEDVKQVDANFDKHDIPYDVLWLDIEHTDGKKYMTWDVAKFPDSKKMIENVASKGRKMVTIIDPHIKRESGYHIHTEATDKQLYVKKKDGSDYEGWCWPGSSSWIDFVNPDARAWWASKFALDQYQGSTLNLMTWNDMNEPSVFNGPEITMHKDAVHYGNWEHRDVHNLYGMYLHMSTFEGHLQRSDGKERPFVLSRAFFAGSQRYGPIWTGDNKADWSHLKASVPMLLSLNVAGLPFSGADVGGFFGNPEPELLVRWYQAGAFQPFFRGHAHLDTRRREPWLFGEENTKLIRTAIRKRYAILPYLYTLLRRSYEEGLAVMRPLWMEFPEDTKTFSMDDEYLLGSALLVKPVTDSGKDDIIVYFPGKDTQPWYDFDSFAVHYGGKSEAIPTPMYKIPVFIRGGSILPVKERVRRASSLMVNDPYTIVIALNHEGKAEGELYIDDEHSLDYKNGEYISSKISMSGLTITKWDTHSKFSTKSWVERIIVVGLKTRPSYCTIMLDNDMKSLEFTYDAEKQLLVIKKPVPYIDGNFTITMG
ncbi:neutral alpha-glucosidase AB-like isoform X2 [Hydractinia symbiolongicarpus]|uniref:neutral alpha-glucosidase AB-like isoform X2 n=1 Tax=Hydractinia symbiolongicarpus TaxID=13093 RepID=UPI00254DE364|nr:neutral alpha-glucosidase AB-like isoform X2 [Hydractinia symbiolongicarpus]